MIKKCHMCAKVVFRAAGTVSIRGVDPDTHEAYEITSPVCKSCYANMEDVYRKQEEARGDFE